jgi:hypothetical protein
MQSQEYERAGLSKKKSAFSIDESSINGCLHHYNILLKVRDDKLTYEELYSSLKAINGLYTKALSSEEYESQVYTSINTFIEKNENYIRTVKNHMFPHKLDDLVSSNLWGEGRTKKFVTKDIIPNVTTTLMKTFKTYKKLHKEEHPSHQEFYGK